MPQTLFPLGQDSAQNGLLDTFTDASTMAIVHAQQHNILADAVIALESYAKVPTDPNGIPIPSPSGLIITNGWDNAWRAAKYKALNGLGVARVTAIGGSQIEGVNSSSFTSKAGLAVLQTALVARGLPVAALCFLPNASNNWPQPVWQGVEQWHLFAAPTSTPAGGLASYPEYNATATNPLLSFTPSFQSTALDAIYYDGGPNLATWQWQVDSGTLRTVTLTNSGTYKRLSNEPFGADLSGLPLASHVIRIGNPSASSSMRLIAGIVYPNGSAASGLQIARCAQGGMGLARNYGGSVTFPRVAGAVLPADACLQWQGSTDGLASTVNGGWPWSSDLYIIDMAGDAIGTVNIDPSAGGRVLERMIKAMRRGSRNCSILLFGPGTSGDYSDSATGSFNFQSFLLWRRIVTDIVTAYQCAYLDLTQRWSCLGGTDLFQPTNGTDPLDLGYADMGAALASVL